MRARPRHVSSSASGRLQKRRYPSLRPAPHDGALQVLPSRGGIRFPSLNLDWLWGLLRPTEGGRGDNVLVLNPGPKSLAWFCSLGTSLGCCENKPGLACWVTETQVEYTAWPADLPASCRHTREPSHGRPVPAQTRRAGHRTRRLMSSSNACTLQALILGVVYLC